MKLSLTQFRSLPMGIFTALVLTFSGCRGDEAPENNVESSKLRATTASLPALTASPFLNTKPDATYVGMEACRICHEDQFHSYLETAHSLALADIDLDEEPPSGEFHFESERLIYRVSKRDGNFYHAEFMTGRNGDETLLQEHPMRYVMGSGRFSRSYLVEIDGFLMESPVTWYSARRAWGLSPGYAAHNLSFSRPTEIRCVSCHAGRVEPVERSPHRLKILEQAIGCERCHGPGSLHVAHRTVGGVNNGSLSARDADLTIVNPHRLSRELSEDICSQCHLHGEAAVALRGRDPAEYRPGLPLSDFLVHFGLKRPREEMSVVGHVEQMRLSECYRQSSEMTCITCHDPHAKPAEVEKTSHYRNVCLKCHQTVDCGIAEPMRRAVTSDDSCIVCHMPQTPTEIPHFSFTHHRVGIHEPGSPAKPRSQPAELNAYDDSRLADRGDRERAFGLAYQQLLTAAEHQAFGGDYSSRALDHLRRAKAAGAADAEVEAALARSYWQSDPERTIRSAQAVIDDPAASTDALSTALFTLGTTLVMTDRPQQAIPVLERLTGIRRQGGVWQALAQAYRKSGQKEKAVEAIRKAIEIDPTRVQPVMVALEIAEDANDAQLLQFSRDRLELLRTR